MLASPSIQQIASALARPSLRPSTRSAQRILCLKLQELPSAGFKRKAHGSTILRTIAEGFLKFSPRVQFREPGWVFLDVASTSHLFHVYQGELQKTGEEGLVRSAIALARDFGFSAQCAISDTAAGAQIFAITSPKASAHSSAEEFTLVPPGEEKNRLKELPLPFLLQLEGLQPWARPSVVENIITFLLSLGFKTVGDLSRFTAASLQERWGDTGLLLWQRLQAQDLQPISPLLATEPLQDYVYLDFPVSLVSLLLHQMQKSLDFLFARLQGRRLFAQKLSITLHCEYSKTQYNILIEPNTPCRDRELFATLLENRLSALNLENPIRDFEIHVMPCPEKARQLDFFEPRETDDDKLQSLFSLLTQSSLKPGLYHIQPSIAPEGGWRLSQSPVASAAAFEDLSASHWALPLNTVSSAVSERSTAYVPGMAYAATGSDDLDPLMESREEEWAIAPRPAYGETVMRAPRPTRLLSEPTPLTLDELQRLKILSTNPIERLENGWWENSLNRRPLKRDYYFAVSPEGQCLWIFQDLQSDEYFLHGYFD